MTDKPKNGGTAVAEQPKPKKAMTFLELLEWVKPELLKVLPKHLTPERMLTLARLAATKTPRLRECTPGSIVQSIVNASKLGLEIGRHAHLVPFQSRHLNEGKGGYECVMIPDYRGLIHLAVRSGKVEHVDARVVYQGDQFEYQLGTDPKIVHVPKLDAERKNSAILAFYAVAHLDGGLKVFDIMTTAEVDAVRARSRAKDDGPWVTDYPEQGRKTVVKRLAKYLPQTDELAAAVELDNRAETGEVGVVNTLIDTEESVNQNVADKTREKLDELKERLPPKAASAGEPVPTTAQEVKEPVAAPAKKGEKSGELPF